MFHVKQSDLLSFTGGLYRITSDLGGIELPVVPFIVRDSLFFECLVLVLPDRVSAGRLMSDLLAFDLGVPVSYFGKVMVDGVDRGQAHRALRSLLEKRAGVYITLSSGLMEDVGEKILTALSFRVGVNYRLSEIESSLRSYGFERESFVVEPGSFSVRGGILDVFPGDRDKPLRFDFLGNTLESLCDFDPASQRSGENISSVDIFPENIFASVLKNPLLDLVPAGVGFYQYRPIIEDTNSSSLADLLSRDRPKNVRFLFQNRTSGRISLNIEVQPQFQRNLDAFKGRLQVLFENDYTTFLCADSSLQLDRLAVLFKGYAFRGCRLSLASGFLDHENKLAVLTDHQVFGRARKRNVIPRSFPVKPATSLEAFTEGDFVVHLDYGVGRYLGLEFILVNQTYREVLTLEYAAGDRVYVPVEKMHRVHKYETHSDSPATLTRLRTTEWEQAKLKTRRAVDNYAKELMALYANRFVVGGYSFDSDNDFQKRMEAAFVYDETEDQLRAVEEIKKDMESAFPMDRLLCGDVGFGKTEVAMRAVFKAVNSSKQVGVLVPTTILAQQHFETFSERFSDYPISVGVLSRFRTSRQTKETLEALKSGSLDVLIGTHRLLSQDVVFKRLGLLIIDEEHRFGVKHKERIKEIKTSVDALSMTATPIPRTLQMSLMGARDISMLKTAPKERQPVETVIMTFDEKRIRGAVLREVDRGGQVFFVHNRVESMGIMLNRLRLLLPEVKVGVGHGQMSARELERIMLGFFHHEFDVLLSTTIVESGLDIPNANTIIVNRADAMGLSQLYQLRGRVGRSHRKAWAYFLAPDFQQLGVNSIRRLNALERHAHYGGGYEIALRDLEIRGSGNVFGTEQSGHISNVGYHLYTKILKETLAMLNKKALEGTPVFPVPEVTVDKELHIPREFIEDTAERIASYRRIADAQTPEGLQVIREELRERFGGLPPQAADLIDAALVKNYGQLLGIKSITVKGGLVQCDFLPEHVEQAGREIIKSLSKAIGEAGIKVELMNNKTLSFILGERGRNDTLAQLRNFLERLVRSSKFFGQNNKG